MVRNKIKPRVMKANSVEPEASPEHEDDSSRENGDRILRTASKEQFDKAQRKTMAQHAGLFRRLAK